MRDWLNSTARHLMNSIPSEVLKWVYSEDMSDEEKEQHPEYTTTGGFLKVSTPTESKQAWWDGLSKFKKESVLSLPNFDAEIFKEITGIQV